MLKNKARTFIVLTLAGLISAAALDGCASSQNPATTQADAANAQPAFALFGPPPKKSGVELWSENCARCHNGRPPNEFSAAQWEVVVHHMRLRANLTGEESREIAKFLGSNS